MNFKNIILVGLGPHAKRIYINFIKNYNYNLECLVELEEKASVSKAFLKENGFDNTLLYLINDNQRDNINLDTSHEKALQDIITRRKITHAIISTEPKAHYAYLKFFIKEKVNILIDKPIIVVEGLSYSSDSRNLFLNRMNEVCKLYLKHYNEMNISVMAQRRYSDVYLFIKNYIKDIIMKYNIGITSIHISTCDGMWNMPDEFFTRENHPYKYGYGKIMHSGYHFIDLLLYLLEENMNLIDKNIEKVFVKSSAFFPKDFFACISSSDYYKMFLNSFDYKECMNKIDSQFGELDFHSILDFTDSKNQILTNVTLDLMQSGYSRRAWQLLPEDTYKGNGRVKHNFIEINLGPLVSIKIFAFQAFLKKEGNEGTKLGENDHFEIQIYRNTEIIGGKVLEKYSIEDFTKKDNYFIGYNEQYRQRLFLDFMNEQKGKSDLLVHKNTMKLVKILYASLKNNQRQKFKLERSEKR